MREVSERESLVLIEVGYPSPHIPRPTSQALALNESNRFRK